MRPHRLAKKYPEYEFAWPWAWLFPAHCPCRDPRTRKIVRYWFQKKDHLGLRICWPSGDAYRQFVELVLLTGVVSTLARYRRITL